MQLEVIHQAATGAAKRTPVLFIHGAWHGAWCWEETFMPYLAERGHNVYALSLRGHGASDGDCTWASVDDYVADVRDVAAAIHPHPALVGHSMGGYVAQKYMATYEQDVPGAALLASIPINGTLPFTFRLLARRPADMLAYAKTLDPYAFIRTPEQARDIFFSPTFPQAKLEATHAKLQSESRRILLDATFRAPEARRYPFPVLVLGAVYDTLFTRQEVQQTARVYGAEAVFFNMAHDMMLEEGWEAVADRLALWLDDAVNART